MATIKDVARRAGVSVATVSRVINRRGYLSDGIIAEVHAAMKELDYHPNEMARSLFRSKSNILGLIVPSVTHTYFSEITRWVEFHAHQRGYKLLVCNSLHDSGKEREYIHMLRCSQVDGIIMGSHLQDVQDYVSLKLPVVSLDRILSEDIPCVCCDNRQGGLLAARHLLERGCKNLVHISGSLDIEMLANRRTSAFLELCRESGASCRAYQLPDSAVIDFHYEQTVLDILTENPDCDGLFATSDVTAAIALRMAARLGKRVPGDIKIVGFDGSVISWITTPQITTVRQPLEEIAKYAVEYLVQRIAGEMTPSRIVLPVELIVRDSTTSHALPSCAEAGPLR